MELVNLYVRKTHKYRDGWADNDSWEFAGTLKFTPPKEVHSGNGYDEGATYVRYARLPSGYDWRSVAKSVRDTMSHSGCRHDYDCCGCATTYARTEKKGRQLKVTLRVSYNY